jgi:IS30 family transposase
MEYLALRETVTTLLERDWSPEQISGWLKRHSLATPTMRISHETIYRSLFVQTRGIFRAAVKKHLRTRRMFRHARSHRVGTRGRIVDAMSIWDRPTVIDDRAIPCHWEGDLLIGTNNSAIATLVERHSRFTVLCHLRNKSTTTVVESLVRQLRRLPPQILKSLTWDRGLELAAHKTLTLATAMAVYFCDPGSPWQRGTNENTNGLLRQYFPKGIGLARYTQHQLDEIAAQLNARPRKTLGFNTPTQVFDDVLR